MIQNTDPERTTTMTTDELTEGRAHLNLLETREEALDLLADLAGWDTPPDEGDPTVIRMCGETALANEANPAIEAGANGSWTPEELAELIRVCTGEDEPAHAPTRETVTIELAVAYRGTRPALHTWTEAITDNLGLEWFRETDEVDDDWWIEEVTAPGDEEPQVLLTKPWAPHDTRLVAFGPHWQEGWYRRQYDEQAENLSFFGPYETAQAALVGVPMRHGWGVEHMTDDPALKSLPPENEPTTEEEARRIHEWQWTTGPQGATLTI